MRRGSSVETSRSDAAFLEHSVETGARRRYLSRIRLDGWLSTLEAESINLDTLKFLSMDDLINDVNMPVSQAQILLSNIHMLSV